MEVSSEQCTMLPGCFSGFVRAMDEFNKLRSKGVLSSSLGRILFLLLHEHFDFAQGQESEELQIALNLVVRCP